MDIANDKNKQRVAIDNADPNQTYFCPECDAALVQKRGEIRCPHFSHKPNQACPDTWTYGNNAWRSAWLRRFPSDYWEIRIGEKGDRHCADLVLFKTAVLFGLDRVSVKDYRQRTAFFRSKGYSVIWVFDVSQDFQIEKLGYERNQTNVCSWSHPLRLFQFQTAIEEGVAFYFDLGILEGKKETTLIRPLENVGNGDSFAVGDPLSATQFVDLLERDQGIAKPAFLRKDLYNPLPLAMSFSFNYAFYGCLAPNHPNHFALRSSCENCPYCRGTLGDQVHCAFRFHELISPEVSQVFMIKRLPNGSISEIDVMIKGVRKHFVIKAGELPYWSLLEIWKNANPGFKALAVRNIKTNHRFYILEDPSKTLAEGKTVMGYLTDTPVNKENGAPRKC
jgi:uncharacterized protein YlaI